MKQWLEKIRENQFKKLVRGMTSLEHWRQHTSLVVRIASHSHMLHLFLVKILKPTVSYRVYKYHSSKPQLQEVFYCRYYKETARNAAIQLANNLSVHSAVVQYPAYISEEGYDQFKILKQMDSDNVIIIYDNREDKSKCL